LVKITGTDDLFPAPGKCLCDFDCGGGCGNCIMGFPPYLYTDFYSSHKYIECE
jgi:hypothetical protein